VTGGSSGIVEHNRRAHDSLGCGHCRKTKTAFSTTLTIKVPFPGAGIVNRSVHTGELEGDYCVCAPFTSHPPLSLFKMDAPMQCAEVR
jgi:hypothetical protein